jgi:hypothetical protein
MFQRISLLLLYKFVLQFSICALITGSILHFGDLRFYNLTEVLNKNFVFFVFLNLYTIIFVLLLKKEAQGKRKLSKAVLPLLELTLILLIFVLYVVGLFSDTYHLVSILSLTLAFVFALHFSLTKNTDSPETPKLIIKSKHFNKPLVTTIILIIILIIGFVVRIWNLDYIQASDNFNLSSAQAFAETGTFTYERSYDITFTIGYVFDILGVSLFNARLPFVIIGLVAVYFSYLIGRFISKQTALLSAFFTAISPDIIEQSTAVREYSINFLLLSACLYLLLLSYSKMFTNSLYKLAYYLSIYILLCSIIFIYGSLTQNFTTGLIILILTIFTIFIVPHIVKKEKYYYFILLVSYLIIGLIFYYSYLTGLFAPGINLNVYWVRIFTDPMISYPMQWFSYVNIGIPIILLILILPIFNKNAVVTSLTLTFFTVVLLFAFKFINDLNYVPTRYLFILYPVYVIIFSIGLLKLISLVININLRLKYILIVPFVMVAVNVGQNVLHAARHDLVENWPYESPRRPTAIGTRADVERLNDYIRKENLIDVSKPIILDSFDPAWIQIPLGYKISTSSTFSDNGSGRYERAENVFLENDWWGIHEFTTTLDKYDSGFYIARSSKYIDSGPYHEETRFSLIAIYENFNIYYWESNKKSDS